MDIRTNIHFGNYIFKNLDVLQHFLLAGGTMLIFFLK